MKAEIQRKADTKDLIPSFRRLVTFMLTSLGIYSESLLPKKNIF